MPRISRDIQATSQRTNTTNKSKKTKTRSFQSIHGLITERQKKIEPNPDSQGFSNSQGTQYTHLTGKTRSNLSNEDFELNYQEFEKQQIRQVFIDKEQQKMIHTILDIARKGKINQKNAFQIPLKLASQQILNPTLNKFWKFASQLLGTSINIFDKRIQNTWINTNIIHDKLARMNLQASNSKNAENQDLQFSDKNAGSQEMLIIPLQQFKNTNLLDSIQLGQSTLGQADKITIKKHEKHYNVDPLFFKKLMTFDNSSNNSLLLNVFELGSGFEIKMFTNDCKRNSQNQKTEGEHIPANILGMVQETLKSQNIEINNKIQNFKQINFKTNRDVEFDQENRNKQILLHDEAFQQMLQEEFHNYQVLGHKDHSIHPLNEREGEASLMNILSEENGNIQPLSIIDSQPENYHRQNLLDIDSYHSQDNFLTLPQYFSGQNSADHSFHSVMTPWEMQFKNGKLQKKKTVRRRQAPKKRQKVEPGEIDFDSLIIIDRSSIISKDTMTKKSKAAKKQTSNKNKNLVPSQMLVYEKYNYNKVKNSLPDSSSQRDKQSEEIASFLAPDPSMMEPQLQPNTANLQSIPQQQQILGKNMLDIQRNSQDFDFQSQTPLDFQRGLNKKVNIRQLKKVIFDEVCDERQLRISELDINVDPSNILITFLHLAGEKNLVVRDVDNQSDVVLTWQ